MYKTNVIRNYMVYKTKDDISIRLSLNIDAVVVIEPTAEDLLNNTYSNELYRDFYTWMMTVIDEDNIHEKIGSNDLIIEFIAELESALKEKNIYNVYCSYQFNNNNTNEMVYFTDLILNHKE